MHGNVITTVTAPITQLAPFLELLAGDLVLLPADDTRAAEAMQSDVYHWDGAIGEPLPRARPDGAGFPSRGDVVRIHYAAWLADAAGGAPFDSSRSGSGGDGPAVCRFGAMPRAPST